MGLFKCPKHGMQLLTFVSPKLAEYIQKSQTVDFNIKKICLNLDDGKQSMHTVDEDFAEEVSKKYSLDGETLKINNVEAAFDVYCSLTGICSSCFTESMQKLKKS
jgi:hypothetical protein